MSEIQISNCPICGYPSPPWGRGENDLYIVDCIRCKKFRIDEEVLRLSGEMQKLRNNADKLSGLNRLLTITAKKSITIYATNLNKILQDGLIPEREDIVKKAEFLLNAIKRRTKIYGDIVQVNGEIDPPLAFAANSQELEALLLLLQQKGDILIKDQDSNFTYVQITALGWIGLQKQIKDSNQGFIAVWFDEKGRLDEAILKTQEAIHECGFKSMCIREEYYRETILEKAIGEIKRSRFMVANLTGHRSSVYFEAGYAQGMGIDVIYVCDKEYKDDASFYPKNYNIYFYSNPAELKEMLITVIRSRV